MKTNFHPRTFPCCIITSQGSTLTFKSTSPRTSFRLVKDPYNSPLWNPSLIGNESKVSEELVKFKARYSDSVDWESLLK